MFLFYNILSICFFISYNICPSLVSPYNWHIKELSNSISNQTKQKRLNGSYLTLLSLSLLSEIFPSDVQRKFSAILYSRCSYPLSSATKNSFSPKSTYVDIGSTSTTKPQELVCKFSYLNSVWFAVKMIVIYIIHICV